MGVKDQYNSLNRIGNSYVFDLAGLRQWQKCEGMEQLEDRFEFESGVLDGKVYAF